MDVTHIIVKPLAWAAALLFILLSLSNCQAPDPNAIASPPQSVGQTGQAIVGGDVTRAYGATGYLLAYQHNTGAACTATLVSYDLILTAAHCFFITDRPVDPATGSSGAVFTLGYDATQPQIQRRIERIHLHPEYDPLDPTLANDIAVARLAQPITSVLPALISFTPARTLVGREVTLVGYGISTTENNSEDEPLDQADSIRRQAQVTVDSVSPNDSYWLYRFATGQTSACSGDSGGPAYLRSDEGNLIVGITSFGDERCLIGGGQTRIDIYEDWLAEFNLHEPSTGLPRACSTGDGVCDGSCAVDNDCDALLCPPGTCGTATADCLPALVARAGTQCYYLSDAGQVCGSSAIAQVKYDATSSTCSYYDRLGAACGQSCASCTTNGLCGCDSTPPADPANYKFREVAP